MCTSTCTKKGRSCLKNVLEFFHVIDLVDKAETMGSVYCICISGKYLIFYYRGGRSAELESFGEAEGAREGRRRDTQEGAAGSGLVPLLFTLDKNDCAMGRILGEEKKKKSKPTM